MNKVKAPIVISGIIILAIIFAVAYLIIRPNQSNAPANQPTKKVEPPLVAGKYVDYKEGIIKNTKGPKLLFFYADWCPQCRTLEDEIKTEGVPLGMTIIKVNFDNSQELREKYGVTMQTTIVRVDDNGKEIRKFVAYDTPNLKAVIEGTR